MKTLLLLSSWLLLLLSSSLLSLSLLSSFCTEWFIIIIAKIIIITIIIIILHQMAYHYHILSCTKWFIQINENEKDELNKSQRLQTVLGTGPMTVCKYEMDLASIVEDTERTRFCPQTDRRTRWNQYTQGSHTSGPTKNKDFSRTFPGPWSN